MEAKMIDETTRIVFTRKLFSGWCWRLQRWNGKKWKQKASCPLDGYTIIKAHGFTVEEYLLGTERLSNKKMTKKQIGETVLQYQKCSN